jgi:hypothetical protein
LTQSGWKPANLVKTSDYVVKVSAQSVDGSERNEYDAGVPVEKIFDFFSLCGVSESVTGSASQFHGDGIPEEKIDVITVNWMLTDKRNISTDEHIRKLIFTNPDMMPGHLFGASESELNSALFRLGLSSFGGVRGSGDLFSLFGSGVLKADDVCLTAIARFDAAFDEQASNKRTRRFIAEELNRASENAFPGAITFHDLIFERVVAVDTIVSDCHVYNLETATGWYVANNLSIHNCRCYAAIPSKSVKPLRGYVVYEY